jgi:hypothetical protein
MKNKIHPWTSTFLAISFIGIILVSSLKADNCITLNGPVVILIENSATYTATGSNPDATYNYSSSSSNVTIDPDSGAADAGEDESSSEDDVTINASDDDGNSVYNDHDNVETWGK